MTWLSEIRALSLDHRTLGLLNHGRRGEGKSDRSSPFVKEKLYLSIFRERGREGEREGEKHRSVASCMYPNWGLSPQPRHVP